MSDDALTAGTGHRQPYYGEVTKKVEKPLPEIGPHKSLQEINLAAAIRVAEKKKLIWQAARIRLDRATADAVATHTALPNNYWLEEFRARGHYGAALMLVELLSEMVAEQRI